MRSILFASCLLALFPPAAALADYEAREKEELDNLSRMDIPPEDRDRAKDGLTRYFDLRERALVDGLKLLGETSVGDQAAKWNEVFDRAGSDGVRLINDLVRADTAQALKVRLLGLAQIEAIFWGKIRAMPLAETRDRLVAWNEQFRVERENLSKKWRAQTEQDDSIDSRTQAVQEELASVFEQATKEVAADREQAKRVLRTLVKVWASAPGAPLKDLAKVVEMMLKTLDSMGSTTAGLVATYSELYRREETVVFLFSDTRAAVKAFLAKTNLTTAQNAAAEARSKTLDLAGQVASDGGKADATEFAGDCLEVLKNHYDRFEDEYEAFANEFKEIFIGAIGDRTVDDLLEKNRWERWENDMRSRNIEAALADLHGDFQEWTGVVSDASELTEADKELIKAAIREDIERLDKGIDGIKALTASDKFRLLFDLTFRRSLEEKAKKD